MENRNHNPPTVVAWVFNLIRLMCRFLPMLEVLLFALRDLLKKLLDIMLDLDSISLLIGSKVTKLISSLI
jgi:hypothetical protein